jgi:hypothetical protein
MIAPFLILGAAALFSQEEPRFADDFNDGHHDGWTPAGGRWSAEGGAVTVAEGGGTLWRPGDGCKDFTFEADVRLFANEQRAGFIVRASDAGGPMNGYFVALRKSADRARVELIRVTRGGWLCLQDPMVSGISLDASVRVRVVAIGSRLWVYVRDMDRPVITELDAGPAAGAVGFKAEQRAAFDNAALSGPPSKAPPPPSAVDFSWVKGAIFFPSRVVNSVQLWEEYDPVLVDRELHYAKVYGLTAVSVYLNYLVWRDADRKAFLRNFEDFLARADRHGLKVSPILFDQCGNEDPHLAPQNPPLPGVHNARMMRSPHRKIVAQQALYDAEKAGLRQYAIDVAGPHADDPRIFLWQAVNEPLEESIEKLVADAYGWIKSTGTKIPVASTASSFLGGRWSDVYTLHVYLPKKKPPYDQGAFGHLGGSEHLNTETVNRPYLSVPKIADAFRQGRVGWMMWDLMIGNLNTRWEWGSPKGAPEPSDPFHGLVYPDGHPWSVDDVRKILGTEDLSGLPVFDVSYFKGTDFKELVHTSIAPRIDFDLTSSWGTGSIDPQHGMPEDGFSVRWTGKVAPPKTGTYTFTVDGDETVRLLVGGRPVVQKTTGTRGEVSGTVELTGGAPADLVVEYVDTAGDTNLHVTWSGPGFGRTFLPGRR